jgi:predicted HicB family RNase H-like nuclease
VIQLLIDREEIPMPETVVHFQVRMPPHLHEQLASWAKEDKASLNMLVVSILEKAIEQHKPEMAGSGSAKSH